MSMLEVSKWKKWEDLRAALLLLNAMTCPFSAYYSTSRAQMVVEPLNS